MNDTKKRIAVFQAYHSLQVHTKYVVQALIDKGFDVDVFLFHCGSIVAQFDVPKAIVYDFSPDKKKWNDQSGIHSKIISAFSFFVVDPLFGSDRRMLSKSVLDKTKELLRKNRYEFFIGVEKMGMIWAGMMGISFDIPFYYYSLELYLEDYSVTTPFLKRSRFRRIRTMEKRFHAMASGTIIQDAARANALFDANGISDQPTVFLPVCISGFPIWKRSSYLRQKYSLSDDTSIILLFGLISKARFSIDVARVVQSLQGPYVVVLHGPVVDDGIIDSIASIAQHQRVIVSTDILSSEEIIQLVSSADIGLCFYGSSTFNEYHSGYSSEKLARYYQAGIPVISFDYPTYISSVRDTKSGICIHSMEELPAAVQLIEQQYDYFSKNAFSTFQRSFNFETRFDEVLQFMLTKR